MKRAILDSKSEESASTISVDLVAEEQKDREAARSRQRRRFLIYQASVLEVLIYTAVAFGFAYRQFLDRPHFNNSALFVAFTAPEVLFSMGMSFISGSPSS
jgi:hypothetical protein